MTRLQHQIINSWKVAVTRAIFLAQDEGAAYRLTIGLVRRCRELGVLWVDDPVEHLVEDAQRFHRVKHLYRTCEEVTGMLSDQYLRCGAPAHTLVKHVGRDEGPYWMCPTCASHNINNRHAEDVTP